MEAIIRKIKACLALAASNAGHYLIRLSGRGPILSKLGKHTIPYSVLQAEREKKREILAFLDELKSTGRDYAAEIERFSAERAKISKSCRP